MPALYRTYRPQKFSQVIGQDTIKTTLQNAILNKRTVHSYLFSGPRGTGKTTMARIFAKAINCLQREAESAEPCNQCQNCQSINEGSFIDLIEIDAASNRGIDEIRNLKEAIRFAPSQKDGYKIYIIDEAHMLTKDASNALLKTLEEPPHNTIFILATTDAHKMIPTILSRVQKFDFKPLSHSDLKKKILFITQEEKVKIDDIVVNQIIIQAMGGARDAESILGKLISSGSQDITYEFASTILGHNSYFEAYTLLEKLSNNNILGSIQHIHKLHKEGYEMNQLVINLLSITHNIFLNQISPNLIDKTSLLEEEYIKIESISKNISKSRIISLIEALEQIKSQTNTAYLPYLPLELSIVKIWDTETQNPVNTVTQSGTIPTQNNTSSPKLKSRQEPIENKIDLIKENPTNIVDNTKIEAKTVEQPQPVSDTPLVKEKSNSNLYTIQKEYPNISKALSKTNKSLAVILSQTQPVDIADDKLKIAVESEFYKSRLEKNTNLILEQVTAHFGGIMSIEFTTQKISITPVASNIVEEDNNRNENTDINSTIADIFKDSF